MSALALLQDATQASGPLPGWAQAALAVLVFIVGGGTVGRWLAGRVRSGQMAEQTIEMGKVFPKREELDGLRKSLEASVHAMALDVERANAASRLAVTNAETALQTAQRIDTESKFRWESIAKEMSETARTLERVIEKVQGVSDKLITLEAEARARHERGAA